MILFSIIQIQVERRQYDSKLGEDEIHIGKHAAAAFSFHWFSLAGWETASDKKEQIIILNGESKTLPSISTGTSE